jgi:transposase
LNKQIRQLKNQVQGVLSESGVADRKIGQRLVKAPTEAEQILNTLPIPQSSRMCIRMSLRLLEGLLKEKQALKGELLRVGKPFEAQVKLLMSIRGVTPLLALAFLADVGDISRFSSLRKLYAYLGVVPSVRSSGNISRTVHLNRRSRALARTIFTQAIPHLADSSPLLQRFYRDLVDRKGFGRARIAVIRKVFGIMRRMLLSGTPYRWLEPALYERKLRQYQRELEKMENQQEAA